MKNPVSESIRSAIKNWWISLIIGILFLVMGLWMLFAPGVTFAALVIFFSVFMFVSGVFEIAFAASNTKVHGWGWYLVVGIVDLLVGFYLISHPELTELIIPIIIALWLMFRGFTAIGFSVDAQRLGARGWGWYLLLGLAAVVCSVIIIWQPITGAILAVYMAALAFLMIGLFRIFLSLDLKRLGKKMDD